MTNFLSFDIFLKVLFQQKSIFTRVTKKKVKSRFKHVLHDIFKKYFKHNYNITIETVLTIKKTVDNLFGVKSLIWPYYNGLWTRRPASLSRRWTLSRTLSFSISPVLYAEQGDVNVAGEIANFRSSSRERIVRPSNCAFSGRPISVLKCFSPWLGLSNRLVFICRIELFWEISVVNFVGIRRYCIPSRMIRRSHTKNETSATID